MYHHVRAKMADQGVSVLAIGLSSLSGYEAKCFCSHLCPGHNRMQAHLHRSLFFYGVFKTLIVVPDMNKGNPVLAIKSCNRDIIESVVVIKSTVGNRS